MHQGKKKDTQIIQSLDKGLFLLEVVEQACRPVSLNDLWEKLEWDKATIHRILRTLEKRGYLQRNTDTKQYTLGLKIFGLYDSLIRNFDIQKVTRPYLEEIAEKTGETTHLAVPIGKNIVFIDQIASQEVLSVKTQIGAHEPAYCTALGRAILAYLDVEELGDYIHKPLVKYTALTIIKIKELMKALEQVKAKGYAIDNEEYIDGIRCVAAPILNNYGFPIAAIGVSGPKNRAPLNRVNQYGVIIKKAGLEISKRIGWRT